MKFCPECGEWGQNPYQIFCEACPTVEMKTVTTANRFCGHCDKIFDAKVTECTECGKPTFQIKESHLKANLALSGTGMKAIWEQ